MILSLRDITDMKKETLIKQHDIKDCGAACLASVSAHYGLKIPIAKIRQICHTDKRGTNVLGMVQGLEALGFNAKGVKGGADALPEIPLPAIAHVIVKEQLHHFVVMVFSWTIRIKPNLSLVRKAAITTVSRLLGER
jgi:ATP-binding cassette subfamily B protein